MCIQIIAAARDVQEKTEIYAPFNILPLNSAGASQPIMQLEEVSLLPRLICSVCILFGFVLNSLVIFPLFRLRQLFRPSGILVAWIGQLYLSNKDRELVIWICLIGLELCLGSRYVFYSQIEIDRKSDYNLLHLFYSPRNLLIFLVYFGSEGQRQEPERAFNSTSC